MFLDYMKIRCRLAFLHIKTLKTKYVSLLSISNLKTYFYLVLSWLGSHFTCTVKYLIYTFLYQSIVDVLIADFILIFLFISVIILFSVYTNFS